MQIILKFSILGFDNKYAFRNTTISSVF